MRPADSLLVVEAAFLLHTVRYGLRWLHYPTLRRLLHRSASILSGPRAGTDGVETEERVLRAIRYVWSKGLASPSCLEEALTVQWMLGRRGMESQVRMGVVKAEGGTLLGHAWAEREGRVVSVDTASPKRYVVLTPPMIGE